jgi:hypothetical protein
MTSHDIFLPQEAVDSAPVRRVLNFGWIDAVEPTVLYPTWFREHWKLVACTAGATIAGVWLAKANGDFLTEVVKQPVVGYVKDKVRALFSRTVAVCQTPMLADAHREAFRQLVVRKLDAFEGSAHSHDEAAADRTSSNDAIDGFIDKIGCKPYSISMSHRDVRSGNDGARDIYVAKDVAIGYTEDKVKKNTVFKMIDVVCHMSKYQLSSLAKRMRPIVMYDFVPVRPCGQLSNAQYTTLGDGRVLVTVDGGGRYIHELWDFDTDCICFDYWNGTAIYMVEAVRTNDPNRRIIGLFPVTFVYGPVGWFISGMRLGRRFVAVPSYITKPGSFFSQRVDLIITRYNNTEGELRACISQAGMYHCIDLPDKRLVAIIQRMVNKERPEISDVERMLRDMCKEQDAMTYAPLLHSIGISAAVFLAFRIMTNTGQAAQKPHIRSPNYQTLEGLDTEDGKDTTRYIGPTFMPGNVGPAKSYNNDRCFVKNRVEKVRNTEPNVPAIFRKYAAEFRGFLVPEYKVHTGVPFPIEQILEWQNRPTQLDGWEAAKSTSGMHKFMVKVFQKAETYGKLGYPRGISTVNADDRVRYSCYVYAFYYGIMKYCLWYAFGLNPVDLAAAVHKMAQDASFIYETDYSNWDGTHSLFNSENQLAILLRYFAPCYHAEITRLHESGLFPTCITTFGVVYNAEAAQLSGRADTALFNSCNNKSNDYIARRVAGSPPEVAYKAPGIFGGDDGATTDIDVKSYERTIKRLGHTLKAKVVPRGHPLGFLGRIYPDPSSNNWSFYDPKRCIMKLGVTTSPVIVPDGLCLARKAEGLLVTDPLTPFLSNWARAVARLYPQYMHISNPCDALVKRDRSWFSQYHVDVQFPQEPDQSMTYEFMAMQMDVGVDELKEYCAQLDDAKCLADFPINCFAHIETPVSVPAVLDGEVVRPPVINEPATSQNAQRVVPTAPPAPVRNPRPANRGIPRSGPGASPRPNRSHGNAANGPRQGQRSGANSPATRGRGSAQ